MWRGLIALTFVTMPVLADDFVDRWPHPVYANTIPVEELAESVWPKLEKPKKANTFVCHKRYYYKRGYRYWRCKRN